MVYDVSSQGLRQLPLRPIFSPLCFGLASLTACDFPWQMCHMSGNLDFLCIFSSAPTALHIGIWRAPCSKSDFATLWLPCSIQDSKPILWLTFLWNWDRRFHDSTALTFCIFTKLLSWKWCQNLLPTWTKAEASVCLGSWILGNSFLSGPLWTGIPHVSFPKPLKRVKTLSYWTCDRLNPAPPVLGLMTSCSFSGCKFLAFLKI